MAGALRGAAGSRRSSHPLTRFLRAHVLNRALLSPCCEQAEEPQTFHERGDDTTLLRTNYILTYIM